MLARILKRFGLDREKCTVRQYGTGLINQTWEITDGDKNYILQRINDQVFKAPKEIDSNISKLKNYLNTYHPQYLFVSPIPTLDGQTLIHIPEGYFRLFVFVAGSHTINFVNNKQQAYEAAKQFGKFSKLLSGFDPAQLAYTLPDFHNLLLRYGQFKEACQTASADRSGKASEVIGFVKDHNYIVQTYQDIIADKSIPLRVIHHDTKISNVLFNSPQKGLCVIDLDTVMPGYYISDIGDMMRTYLSPANEEEKDLSKIFIRKDHFKAIYDGYLSEMGTELTGAEKNCFIYAGKFIIYMQAMRFLTDYLNNDRYYGAAYPDHNLYRAKNQVALLTEYLKAEKDLQAITADGNQEILLGK